MPGSFQFAGVDTEEWRAAQRRTFIPGLAAVAAWVSIIVLVVRDREAFFGVIGESPDWSAWWFVAWLVVTWLGVATCMGTVSVVYYRYTRRRYAEDRVRVGFAQAGGYDIGNWAPVASYVGVFAVYWATNPGDGDDPIGYLRNPWLFSLVGAVVANVLSAISARVVFRARFGRRVEALG